MDAAHWFQLILTGLVCYGAGYSWLIQRANYRLFALVPDADFVNSHQPHTRLIAPVVILPAFLTNILSIVFIFARPESVPVWAAVLVAALGVVILVVSARIEIPTHMKLDKEGKSLPRIDTLVKFNLLRSLPFTGQALLMLWLITVSFAPV
jgi:hypothetical protein